MMILLDIDIPKLNEGIQMGYSFINVKELNSSSMIE